MTTLWHKGTLMALALGAALGTLGIGQAQAEPSLAPTNFADPAFKEVWTRTDAPVENGSAKRSYYWGPTAGFITMEDYEEGLAGKHLVQYFDKSRMEINNPAADKKNPFYVTNGLLTRELITGQMQVGNTKFVTRYPAEINIASDADDQNAPTYASFQGVVASASVSDLTGETIISRIDRAGQIFLDNRYDQYGVKYAYHGQNGNSYYNIPSVFWNFLNASGSVMVNGKQTTARLSEPFYYAAGFPLSSAYWANVKIEGRPNTDVLIQPYERRVLTYVPSAPEGFKVQMGNIGLHYYDWRYKSVGKPAQPLNCSKPVPYSSFQQVWTENATVQAQVGCYASYIGFNTSVTVQPFERGLMVDIVIRDHAGPQSVSTVTKDIYVIYNNSTVEQYKDSFVDGSGESPNRPPAGLIAPKAGFGKVWRENTSVQSGLGWATGPESSETAGNSSTLFLYFDKGLMLRVVKKIYVFYGSTGRVPGKTDRWSAYADKGL